MFIFFLSLSLHCHTEQMTLAILMFLQTRCGWYNDHLQAGWPRNCSSTRGSSFLQKCPRWFWGPPSLLFDGYKRPLPVGQVTNCEADSSAPSNVQAKNVWGCITAIHMPSWHTLIVPSFTEKHIYNKQKNNGDMYIYHKLLELQLTKQRRTIHAMQQSKLVCFHCRTIKIV